MEAIASQALQAPSAPPLHAGETLQRQSVVRDHVENVDMVRGGLEELGISRGLADVLAQDDSRIGLRIYLLDNSGSMQAQDGNKLHENGRGEMLRRPCSRWEEICIFAKEHAEFNLMVGTPCEFVLLSSFGRAPGTPSKEGRDYVRIDRTAGDKSSQLASLQTMMQNNGPRGTTPIADRLDEIFQRVSMQTSELAQKGQCVFLTIATDGLPTSAGSGDSTPSDKQHLVERLRYHGGTLPLQLVVRLCTDETSIVDFYNDLDRELELPLDILDDIASEGGEIACEKKNNWFAYSPLLHRLREAGTLCKVLDSIDEGTLSPQEVRHFAELLAGSPKPLTDLSDRAFINEIKQLVEARPHVYDAVSQRMQPAINIAKLRASMKVGFRGNVLPLLLPFLF
jgi:hypothetical protein